MTIGEKIVKLRKAAGYSQEEFSELMGVSRQAVSKWENDTAQPTAENMSAIAKLFGVTLSSLLDDEDVQYNSEKTAQVLPPQTVSNDNKIFVRMVKLGIIALGLICIFLCFRVQKLENEISVLRDKTEDKINHLQIQINSLANRQSYSPPADSNDFVDSDVKVVDYDIGTNRADIKFTFIPKDYSQNTTAKVLVKTPTADWEQEATLQNGAFSTIMNVECTGDMTIYFYLTDGENTRSFSMGTIENPAILYSVDIERCEYTGDIKTTKDKIKINGELDVDIRYSVKSSADGVCAYPKKATVEIYAGDKLLKSVPHQRLIDMDFDYSDESAYEQASAYGGRTYFTIYLDEEIENQYKATQGEIRFEYLLVDNNGRTYRQNAIRVLNNPQAEVTQIY